MATAYLMTKLKNRICKHIPKEDLRFALKNINTQIKLFYGENYGLDIISRRGVGTRVRLRLHTLNACDTSAGEELQNTSSV